MNMKMIKRGLGVYRVEGLTGVARRLLRRLADQGTPSRDFWSEYLRWLTYANSGMLSHGNVWCMNYAIRNLLSEAPILEIGSFCGLSTNVIAYLKEKNNVRNPLITCDKWIFEGAEGGGMLGDSQSVTHAEYKKLVKETFLRNVQTFSRSDLPFTIELFSDEFFSAWTTSQKLQDVFGREVKLGGPISFCYIDGNHSYDFARRDFENCDRFLEEGGFILFDDSADGSEWEVCQVVQEVIKTRHYDLIAKNPNYFFRKK
jgi:hypothetical protein